MEVLSAKRSELAQMHRQLAVFSAKSVRAEISTSSRVKKNLLSRVSD